MDITSSTQDGIVNLQFVLPADATQETCSQGLICAYQACEENGLSPTWVSSEECLKLKPVKQDVFVVEPFEGEAFEYLTAGFKCVRVLGPRCLLTCLHRKEPIPELPSPIHNTAMKGLVITTTGFDKQEKTSLQTKVERMAGIYSNNFHEGVTHLVVKSVGSKKYIVAMEKEMPVMTGEWIHSVWEAVNKDFREDIIATDEQFLSHNCPPLYGLTICLSQISRKDKEVLRKLISDNGGIYSPSLEMDKTHVLILPAAEGEKYNYAKNWRIHCLSPEWVYDSIQKGYAMDMENYKVQKQFGASSPKKESDPAELLPPDISMCSTIMMNESQMPFKIDETMNSTLAPGGVSFMPSKKSPNNFNNERVAKALEAVDQLELQKAKKAGLFLDGCKIFLSGFDDSQMEKLRRILNNGGATRFNQLTEAVSHVVIGKIENEHISIISGWVDKPHVVYGEWIAECVSAKTQVDEGPFSYFTASLNQVASASPINKPKLKPHETSPAQGDETFVDEALMQQYMKGPTPAPRRSSVANDSLNTSALPASQADALHQGIFTGKSITISGYTEEQEDELSALLIDEGAEIVPLDHSGRVNYSCASLTGEGRVHPHAKECFSHLYVEECHEFKALISMEYFYLPLVFNHDPPPLEGCVIAISAYKNKERSFLVNIAQLLGAEFQEMFAKKDNPKKGVRCSTHLICSESEGDKYKAAKKWGVPAVTRDFLLQCASMGRHVSEDDFRVDNDDRIVLDPMVVMKDLLGLESIEPSRADYSPTHVEETNHDVSDCGTNNSFIAPTPVNKKVRALRDQAAADLPSPSNIKTPDLETMRKMYPTPGTKANDSLDEMPTPDTPYGSTWHGPNPPARIRKGFKRLLDALPEDKPPAKKANTPTKDLYNKFFEGVQKTLQAKEAKYASNNESNNKQARHANPAKIEETVQEDMDATEANEMTSADQHGILTGVVVYCNQKLRDQQQEIYQTVASLGGDYRWVYEPQVTHYIHLGRANDTNKEFRMARDQGKFVVAPEWVWMCRDEESKIDESLFPHTHNPKMSLSIISQKSGTPVGTRRGRPRKTIDKHTVDETAEASQMSETTSHAQQSSESDADNADVEEAKKAAALSKQLEELEALANKTSGSGRKNSALRKPSLSERAKNTPPRSGGTPRSAHQTPTNAAMQANTEVAESQNTAITWEDPQEKEARQRISAELTRDTQEILEEQMHQQQAAVVDDDKENTPDIDNKPHSKQSLSKAFENINQEPKQNYVFVLSGINEQEDKDRYVEIIEALGGTVSQEQCWHPSVTHVVTNRPNRSEKILSAIASGRWLLFVSYIEFSMEAGKFVEEEEHEWGNPRAVELPEFPPDSIEEKLAASAHRWRTTLTSNGESRGAFQDMRAIIHSNKERVQSLSRLVNSGHGEVISVPPPYTDGKGITHFFVEPNRNPSKFDLAHFVSQKIPCLQPVYLSNYLILNPIPDAYESCIEDYKKIEKDMRGLLDSEPLMDV